MRFFSPVHGAIVLTMLAGPALTPAARAQLLGTTVTGQMLINGTPRNYFDPASGFVPNGYLNKTSGPTVSIAEPAIEFGYQDSANFITANFTDTGVTLSNVSNSGSLPILFRFTDTAFAGLTLNGVSDSYPAGGINASLSGTVLTLSTSNYLGTSGTFSATYSLTPAAPAVPEPGSLALLAGTGTMGAAFLRRRKRTHVRLSMRRNVHVE